MPGIRFPQLHIAQSVTNRILNVVDDLRESRIIPELPPQPGEPEVPVGTGIEGLKLDQALATPPGPMEMPPGPEGAVAGGVATGTDIIEG